MVNSKLITGSLIESFLICKRQAWLMAHQIIPDQEHPYLELGRLIDEESYIEERKKINLENIAIDLIKTENRTLLIGEVKKSSKAKEVARFQLIFYLYILKNNYGINGTGILLFPEEKRKIRVELTEEDEHEIEEIIQSLELVALQEKPPKLEKIKYCIHCAYREFCWA